MKILDGFASPLVQGGMSRRAFVGRVAAFGIALPFLVAPYPGLLAASLREQVVVAGDILIYLGIMQSKVLSSAPKHYGSHNMMCPVPGGADNYHVMIALFDKATGERITNADVYARVSPLGLVGARKHLEGVTVAGAVTYCNYFDMPATGRYDIKMEIKRSESPKVVNAKFTYRPYAG